MSDLPVYEPQRVYRSGFFELVDDHDAACWMCETGLSPRTAWRWAPDLPEPEWLPDDGEYEPQPLWLRGPR